MISKLKKITFRFTKDSQGVAAIEFALILPILLLLYLGATEASRAISYHSRITSIASALGDLVAQSRTNIPANTLNDYFSASQTILAPYNDLGVQQVVSNVFIDADGNARLVWTRGSNGGVAQSPTNIPANIRNASLNNYVIISEASLSYRPLTNYIFPNNINFYQKFYHLPRQGRCIGINNDCPAWAQN